MADPFLGEIRVFSFNFAPKGWAMCNGQLLPINQNQALFALLGTTYGGNGQTTFALPDLQGRMPLHFGNDPFGASYTQGARAGEESHTLTIGELAQHTHAPMGVATDANSGTPVGNTWAQKTGNPFSNTAPNTTLEPQAIAAAGGSQPHENMSPFLTLNICIALQGIFPSRN